MSSNIHEIWKDVKGFEGVYQISNLGRIKSLHDAHKNLILKQRLKKNGYLQVRLKKNGTVKDCIVHRLVAQAFLENKNNLPCVNHKDENKQNNCVDNLEWCTVLYNNTYGKRIEQLKSKLNKSVIQYDKNWNIIEKYNSCKEASLANKISPRKYKCLLYWKIQTNAWILLEIWGGG